MDRRVRKTRLKLNESLMILIKDKNINQITVKELTDLADINRKTFYLHYKDIFDMVDNIKEQLLVELESVILFHNSSCTNSDEPYSLMKDILEFIDNNSELLSIFLGPHINADSIFIEKIKEIMKRLCIDVWNRLYPNADPKKYDYYYSFTYYGIIGLIQDWINTSKQESIEYMAKLTSDLVESSSKILYS